MSETKHTVGEYKERIVTLEQHFDAVSEIAEKLQTQLAAEKKHTTDLLKMCKDAATALDWFYDALQGGTINESSIVLGLGGNIRAWRMARDCAQHAKDAIAKAESNNPNTGTK